MAPRTPGKPSLSVTEAERVRAALRRLYEGEFKENKTRLGKALGISQPAVTQLLEGTNRPSLDTAKGAAKLEGVPLTSYLDETAADEADDGAFPGRIRAARSARGLNMPDWAIEQMLTEDPPEGISIDPGPLFWFRRIEMLIAATRPEPPYPAPAAAAGRAPGRDKARGARARRA